MTSSTLHPATTLSSKYNEKPIDKSSAKVFTILDDMTADSEDSLSLYSRAQESRRMLRSKMVGRPDAVSKLLTQKTDRIPPEDIIKEKDADKEYESDICTRICIRILLVVMLLSYISTMVTWVSKMRKRGNKSTVNSDVSISGICSILRIKRGDEKQCNDLCYPYRCCWDKDEDCLDQFDANFCAQFLPCRNLLILLEGNTNSSGSHRDMFI